MIKLKKMIPGAAALVTLLSLAAIPAAGQAHRTADGKPDLSGVWQALNTAAWDIQDHSGQLGVPPGVGVVEGNDIPYQPAALAKKKDNFAHRATADLTEANCYMPGVPRATYMPYPFEITQGTNKIQMSYEVNGASRTIHLDKVDPPPADTWMGFSQGHWEGKTLVVDVGNFNDRTWFSRAGDFHSDALHVVERFTPITRDAIRYDVTIEDANVFTRPWKMSMVLYRQLDPNARLMEYKCVELVEETFLGHLRRNQLVKHWEGDTISIDITRKIPAGDKLYQR